MDKKETKRILPQELRDRSGLRDSTLKFWIENGLLDPFFTQEEKNLARRFEADGALKRIKEIQALRENRRTIPEIVEHFKSIDKK